MRIFIVMLLGFASFAFAEEFQCKSIQVIDGDTFICDIGHAELLTVRLYQIDAPELDQFYGEAAKAMLEKYLTQEITLYCVGENKQKQQECRAFYFDGGGCGSYSNSSIGYCLVPYEINLRMIDQGYAWYTPYPFALGESKTTEYMTVLDTYRQQHPVDDYAVYENAARAAKKGLWVETDPTPPWDWRSRVEKMKKLEDELTKLE